MKTLLLFLAFASFANTPNPNQVYIKRITYAGSGCASGTVTNVMAPDAKSFSLIFDDYTAEIGSGVPSGKSNVKCKLTIDLKYPQGWSYTLFNFDYRGYAALDAGVVAKQQSRYYFQSTPNDYVTFGTTFNGAYDSDFFFRDQIALDEVVWSSCDKQRALHVDSDLSVSGNGDGIITIDTIDGKLTHIYGIQWQQC